MLRWIPQTSTPDSLIVKNSFWLPGRQERSVGSQQEDRRPLPSTSLVWSCASVCSSSIMRRVLRDVGPACDSGVGPIRDRALLVGEVQALLYRCTSHWSWVYSTRSTEMVGSWALAALNLFIIVWISPGAHSE